MYSMRVLDRIVVRSKDDDATVVRSAAHVRHDVLGGKLLILDRHSGCDFLLFDEFH